MYLKAKKICSFILVLCMLCTFVPVAMANAAGEICVSVDKTSVVPGDELTYTLNIPEMSMSGLQVELNYDTNKLTYTGGEKGEAFNYAFMGDISNPEAGIINMVIANSSPVDVAAGMLAKLTFKVNDDAESGAVEFEVPTIKGTPLLTLGEMPAVRVVDNHPANILKIKADKTEVTHGEELNVSFGLSRVTNYEGLQLTINYDKDILEIVYPEGFSEYQISGDYFMSTIDTQTPGTITIVTAKETAEEFVNSEEMVSVAFRVREGAAVGDAVFSVSENKGVPVLTDELPQIKIVRDVNDVIALIDEIGEVTLSSREKIEQAKAAYDELTEEQKELVTNKAVLDNALAALEKIKTVTFEANGGEPAPQMQEVMAGEKAAEPTKMTKEGYDFAGWYTDAEFNKEWDFAADIVENDTILYAKWNKISISGSGGMTASGISFSVNLTGDADVGTVFAGLYSADGALKSIKQYPASEKVEVVFDSGVTGAFAKIMWWNDNQQPMCEAWEIPLQ